MLSNPLQNLSFKISSPESHCLKFFHLIFSQISRIRFCVKPCFTLKQLLVFWSSILPKFIKWHVWQIFCDGSPRLISSSIFANYLYLIDVNLFHSFLQKSTKKFIISTIPFISHFQIYFSETKYDCFSFLHIRVSEAFRLGQKRPQKFWSGAYLLFSQKCVVFTRNCKWVRISLIELSWTANNDDITCITLFAVNWWCGNGW